MRSKMNRNDKYKAEHSQLIGLRLYEKGDADIIDYLSRHGKQPEIKRLIREAIAKENEENSKSPFDY